MTKTRYDSVIPTGWLTAYGRTFTDIPYAKEVFNELEKLRNSEATDTFEVMKDSQLAPQYEARYKLLDKLIKETDIEQILEVAAGLCTRGIDTTQNESITYVEVDLPAMMAEKRKIVAALERDGTIAHRPNLHLEDASAVELLELKDAVRHFDKSKPVVVVNEGLLRYLNFEDKEKYTNNVKALLKEFGGVWVTSDISLPKVIYKENDVMAERRKRISEITKINIADNLFKDKDDAKQYFESFGFNVEVRSFNEVIDEVVSHKNLNMSREYVQALIGSAVVFVMKLV